MKAIAATLILGLALSSTSVLADPYHRGGHRYARGAHAPNRVVVVQRPVHVAPRVVYRETVRAPVVVYREQPTVVYYREQGARSDNTAGMIIGATAGGILGNQIGRGNGRALSTAAGIILGGMIGNGL
ncbi:MAG: glycine zipper 2TM domain-containing protein [Zoogloeaceae bacterium]|jgi:uncharacterized protein YcfJ|nr:glycine zipper 2TM domain-containing protein [Zoogloeaceae bacterium]